MEKLTLADLYEYIQTADRTNSIHTIPEKDTKMIIYPGNNQVELILHDKLVANFAFNGYGSIVDVKGGEANCGLLISGFTDLEKKDLEWTKHITMTNDSNIENTGEVVREILLSILSEWRNIKKSIKGRI